MEGEEAKVNDVSEPAQSVIAQEEEKVESVEQAPQV